MNSTNTHVTVAVPGDLHLTTRDQPNYQVAVRVVNEINDLIRPDFVQFIGDNVQDATEDQFQLFKELTDTLTVRHFALVGDHDIVVGDSSATMYRKWVGEPFESHSLRGFRFVRLNTLEIPKIGFSDNQLQWLNDEFEAGRQLNQQVVLFQHHYPYKVCENYAGPGIARSRELVEAHRPVVVICGHTHYGQIANNGRNLAVATRSIGDPEGGAPGYLIVHVEEDDLALTYRTIEETGPVLLITHPRELLLATDARHIVHEDDEVRVRIWSEDPVDRVTGTIDEDPQFELRPAGAGHWIAPLSASKFRKGEHTLRVDARMTDGTQTHQQVFFFVDLTCRYTGPPGVRPIVRTTAYC